MIDPENNVSKCSNLPWSHLTHSEDPKSLPKVVTSAVSATAITPILV